jgi:DNA/RNA-binding domain of Phe-tRNA-synthetase-like protein
MMQPITCTDAWHTTFPGGHIGLLAMGPVDNTQTAAALEEHKRQLEANLRQQYAGMTRADLLTLPELAAYKHYYRQFNKTYHVQLQLESMVHKGKSLPQVNPLVDACFAAELETHLLTASHDLDKLAAPIVVDASTGEEQLVQMNGQARPIKANDMMMRDGQSVVCTIIYGQDQRTAVTQATRRVLYVTYAPAGISAEAVAQHHDILVRNVRLVAGDTAVIYQEIVTASP